MYPGDGITSFILTSDNFTDKAVEIAGMYPNAVAWLLMARHTDVNNHYRNVIDTPATTADNVIKKVVAGTATDLASEAVDLTAGDKCYMKFSVSGSTLNSFRSTSPSYLPSTSNVSTTDTDLTSGHFGVDCFYNLTFWTYPELSFLRAPASMLPQALRIVEVEIVGSGTEDDPVRANFKQSLDSSKNIDKLAVTWGSFDYKGEPTMLCIVSGDNPYQSGAILEQEVYAKSKNLKVYAPPRDLTEARDLYALIKKDRPNIIAGVHNLAYQCIGHADLEPLAVADFYDGFVQGIYSLKDLERVPQGELERTIKMWLKRLEKSKVITTEKDKHVKKLERVLKL